MISILTCIYAYNYGAVLQAYALQKYIEDCGHVCKQINYQPYYAHKEKNILKNIVWRIYRHSDLKRGHKVFDSFLRRKINMTKVYCSNYELKQNPPESNLFIVGSDQVWNFSLASGDDDAFMLDFVPKDKIKCSYAASIAKEFLSEVELERLKKFLKDFKYISVREQSAVLAINKTGRADSVEVLDPVYLLSAEQWKKFSVAPEINESYILYYAFNSNDEIREYAYALKRKTGLKLYVIGTIRNDKRIKSDKFFWEASPELFVGLFSGASYVVTNSFHGMSFSIIFNKRFKKFDKGKKGNCRLNDLLISLELDPYHLDNIDYNKVNEHLENKKICSYKYLEKIMAEDKK